MAMTMPVISCDPGGENTTTNNEGCDLLLLVGLEFGNRGSM